MLLLLYVLQETAAEWRIFMIEYSMEQAEKELFAVYQVVYADTDIDMWYDWNTRLNDTKFSDQCYWILRNDERIGGAIINNETVMYQFLISPFSDRTVFWKALFSCCKDIINIKGVLQKDINILLTFGYKIGAIRQVMCCPTDAGITATLPDGFSLHVLDDTLDIKKVAGIIMKGYDGGIDNEIFGTPDEVGVIEDAKHLMQVYEHGNLSIYVLDEKDQEIAGLCISGINKNMPLGFAEIGDMCVIPQYRNKRLAEFMLKHVRVIAYE